MAENDDFNASIIEEFRANDGKVGGPFEGATMILLHHTGAKTGKARVNPLVYQRIDADTVAIFASKAGAPDDPQWFRNLLAHPDATAEIGDQTIEVRARVAEGDERARIWERQKKQMPGFAEYEAATTRQIPVVILGHR